MDEFLQSGIGLELEKAETTWPELKVDKNEFVEYVDNLSAKIGESTDNLHIKDLYLVFACLRGDESALLIFEEKYTPVIRRNLGQLNISETVMEEVLQRFRYKLFVCLRDSEPKLSQYNGTSELRSWLRVIAIRGALDFVKARDQKDLPLDDEVLADIIVECDQEILLIKEKYHFEFEKTLKECLQNLDSKDRNILRASALDKLTIDEIGKLYKVHRVTASRWLVSIRSKLKDDVKKQLKANLNIDSFDYKKIAQVLESQLNLSLSRILKPR